MAGYMNELHQWSLANNMQINKQKTKEMVITTSRTSSIPFFPNIERVETFKLLGIVVSNDLKWNPHAAYIIQKANTRLRFLRQLKRGAVSQDDNVTLLRCNSSGLRGRDAVAVWYTDLTADLSDQLETKQNEHSVSYLVVQVSPIIRMNLSVLTWKFYHA